MEQQCKAIKAMFSGYIDRELNALETADVEIHLRQCEQCRAELAKLESTVRAVGNLPRMEAPPDTAERVLEKAGDGEEAGGLLAERRIHTLWPRVFAIAASILLVSATTVMLTSTRTRPEKAPLEEKAAPAPHAVSEPEPSRAAKAEAEAGRRRHMPSADALAPPARISERGFRLETEIAEEVEQTQEPGRRHIQLDVTPTIDMLAELKDKVGSHGGRNISATFESGAERSRFELNFELDTVGYAHLCAALLDRFGPAEEPSDARAGEVQDGTEATRLREFSDAFGVGLDKESDVSPAPAEDAEDHAETIKITITATDSD